jgi:AcrR family transcriptional regulator
MPRPYRLGQRQAAAEQTRARIVAAARALILAEGGFGGFTIDAVARQAGVARMTVYYQFGSKRGLLEALFDSLALRGGICQLGAAFGRPEPLDALEEFIATFCRFWASDRLVLRRLRALAALDPDFEQGVRAREGRRQEGVRALVRRLAEAHGRPARGSVDEAADLLLALTSFETFDALAVGRRGPAEVARLVYRLARAALGLGDA